MSTILKALRRLEEDRSSQSQRPLREEVTRGSASSKSRRLGRPLLALLLGLGVAAGAGALAFWYVGPAPEPAGPTQPTELAAADRASPSAEPAAAAKRPRKPRAATPARRRAPPSPTAAPSAASERELPAGALASKVELVRRPPAEPRIAANESAEPPASQRGSRALPGPMDPAEIPGRHKARPVSRSSSAPAPSVAAWAEAPAPAGAEEPASSQGASAGPVREASRRAPAATVREETKPRAEQPREVASEPLVVAVAPEPAASEPPATPARDEERQSAAPRPEPTSTKAAAERSSKQAAKSAAVAPRKPRPAEAASREIARAEIPGLRVESTVWHPTAERRVALVEFDESAERREIREGDAVGPLVVSKIEPSGVVFIHDGVEVRRRIGE